MKLVNTTEHSHGDIVEVDGRRFVVLAYNSNILTDEEIVNNHHLINGGVCFMLKDICKLDFEDITQLLAGGFKLKRASWTHTLLLQTDSSGIVYFYQFDTFLENPIKSSKYDPSNDDLLAHDWECVVNI